MNKLIVICLYSLPYSFFLSQVIATLLFSLIDIFFIIGIITKKIKTPKLDNWFILAVTFSLLSCIFTLSKSVSPEEALTGLIWIRFPLFALAFCSVSQSPSFNTKTFSLNYLFSLFIFLAFISFELYLEPKTRLTWPFGSAHAGPYFSKVGLPCILIIFSLLAIHTKKSFNRKLLFLSALSTFIIFIICSTGNRIGVIAIVISAAIVFILQTRKIKSLCVLFLVIILGFFLSSKVKSLNMNYDDRHFSSNTLVKQSNSYLNHYKRGIHAFLANPIAGIGVRQVSNYPNHGLKGEYLMQHPHNHYIQVISETGVIGGLFYIMMAFLLIKKSFISALNKDLFSIVSFIIILTMFSPIFQTNDLFGSEANNFTWFTIGIALIMNTGPNREFMESEIGKFK